ncbi:MAG TPA: hypothetical protein ENJ56_06140, partial [Anaerolineae bacterium]|nr:hypothetical protein [Anaerolineae bacterium]
MNTRITFVLVSIVVAMMTVAAVLAADNGADGSRDTGVQVTYFSDKHLHNPVATSTESQINFNSNTHTFPPNVPDADYALRFQAYLSVPESGEYVFTVSADDAAILLLNQRVEIFHWIGDGLSQLSSAPVTLSAGVLYPLELLHYEFCCGAQAVLSIQKVGDSPIIVPASYFTQPDSAFPAQDLSRFNFTDRYDADGNMLVYTDNLAFAWHNWSW